MDILVKSTRYSALSLTDLVSECAGAAEDGAWEEFVARVGKTISLTVLRTASCWGEPSRGVVEDLVQVTYLKLWEDNCRHLRDFAIQHPDGILGYLKKIAANATHDYFRHGRSQSAGGSQAHVSTSDQDVEAGKEVHGSAAGIAFQILLKQIDEHLKRNLTGADAERDRTIFWLYFRQGMSTKEIANLPTMRLGAKGVGSVIERLKHCIREHMAGAPSESGEEPTETKSKIPQEFVIGVYGTPGYGTSIR